MRADAKADWPVVSDPGWSAISQLIEAKENIPQFTLKDRYIPCKYSNC